MIRLALSVLFFGSGISLVHAADLPPLILPHGVGVNIHFVRGQEQDLDLIREAGFKFVRMDFSWASIERRRGEYDFSAYDELTTNLEQRGLRALYILDYSNPLYEAEQLTKNPISGREERSTASPQHPASVAAFARWAAGEPKRQLPILSGEWGYSSHARGVSLQKQAAYLVRQQLVNLLSGIPISIWYDWKNDGEDPKENEHNFGTVLPDLKAKPAYQAVKTMTRELGGFGIEQRLFVANTNDYVLLLTNAAGKAKLAAWTTESSHVTKVGLPLQVHSATGLDIIGGSIALRTVGSSVELTLTEAPQYVSVHQNAATGDR